MFSFPPLLSERPGSGHSPDQGTPPPHFRSGGDPAQSETGDSMGQDVSENVGRGRDREGNRLEDHHPVHNTAKKVILSEIPSYSVIYF